MIAEKWNPPKTGLEAETEVRDRLITREVQRWREGERGVDGDGEIKLNEPRDGLGLLTGTERSEKVNTGKNANQSLGRFGGKSRLSTNKIYLPPDDMSILILKGAK